MIQLTAAAFFTLALTAAPQPAQRVGFSAAEGYQTGATLEQPYITGPAEVEVDATGTGHVTGPTDDFRRFVAFADAIDLAGLRDGDTLGVAFRGLRIDRGRPGAVTPLAVMGLCDVYDPYQAKARFGAQLLFDAAGRVWLDEYQFPVSPAPAGVGVTLPATFDVVLNIRKLGPDAYDVDTTVNGVTLATASARGIDFDRAGVIFQNQGPTKGTFRVDAVEIYAGPAPAVAPAAPPAPPGPASVDVPDDGGFEEPE